MIAGHLTHGRCLLPFRLSPCPCLFSLPLSGDLLLLRIGQLFDLILVKVEAKEVEKKWCAMSYLNARFVYALLFDGSHAIALVEDFIPGETGSFLEKAVFFYLFEATNGS